MKAPDRDKIRSEEKHSLASFLTLYNKNLPRSFPKASTSLLEEYKSRYPSQFKTDGLWSLELHRKKFMDWLPMHLKTLES